MVSKVARFSWLCAVAVMIAGPAAQAASNPVAFSPTTLRFGEVVIGQSETLSATLTNSGASSITVSSLSSSISGFTAKTNALPLTLGPGQSAVVTVTFTPQTTTTYTGSIGINSGLAYLTVRGSGIATKSLAPSPSTLNFGNVQDGNTGKLYLTLTNSKSTSAVLAQASTSGTGYSAVGLTVPLTLAPGQSYTFQVVFSPAAAGSVSGLFQGYNSVGSRIVAVPLSGTGTAAGQLALTPSTDNFGNVTVGSSASASGQLTASGASVTVSSASSSNSQFALSGISLPVTIAAGQSVPFTVSFTPQSSGNVAGTLGFASNASNAGISESLSGTGVTPQTYSVSLTWDASTSTVTGYNVYRGTVSGGPYTRLNSSLDAGTTFVDGAVAASQTYYYVTTAVNSSGQESTYSNQVQVIIP
jgi:hypothetical protein